MPHPPRGVLRGMDKVIR